MELPSIPAIPEDRDQVVGESDALRYVCTGWTRSRRPMPTVLLLGETGTGKELLARTIHAAARGGAADVVVNCAALPADLVESELFGREKGRVHRRACEPDRAASSWPTAARSCSTKSASCRSNCSRSCCACCRRDSSSASAARGRSKSTSAIIAATNRDLGDEVRQGRFRQDLYYRLNVFPITMPSLRDRREDIGRCSSHYLVRRLARSLRKTIETCRQHVLHALESYDWPGNIRELENVLQRAIILSPGTTLTLGDAWLSRRRRRMPMANMTLVELERAAHPRRPRVDALAHRGRQRRRPAARTEAEHAAQPDAQARHRAAALRLGIARPR